MSSPGITTPDSSIPTAAAPAPPFQSATRQMAILLLAHAPFVLLYYYQLLTPTYYRFFPLAVGAFIVFFQQRRSRTVERWNWLSRFLLFCDLLCLTASLILAIPWLAVLGLVLALMAWCMASRQPGYTGSLLSLAVIPLTTLRFGQTNESMLLDWLSTKCLQHVSRICHSLEVLHYTREGNLYCSGKSFSASDLTSAQSLFLCLSLAAVIAGWQRRSILHALALVLCGAATAVCMALVNGLIVIWIWQRFEIDLTSGFGFAVDCTGWFLLTCSILISADQFLSVWTFAVPDIRRQGELEAFLNPLILLWNRWMASAVLTPKPAEIPVLPLFAKSSWVPTVILLVALLGQFVDFLLKRIS